ncbi:MAG: type I DNA topoisomerase [Mycoplasmoidaceae bacterium]
MAKNLVIIESPNKEKTIGKYLGKDFSIIATVGHIRDIPSSGSKAFDPKTYEPNWKISYNPKTKKSKKEVIDKIKAMAEKAEKIYLATDPDREGEAIAWHVYEVLPKASQKKCVRVTFNEITKDAVEEASRHERQIDLNWVHSQFARRVLDRIVGYDLSRFVRDKFNGSSAGRVQSVALKFIYEREQEINKFKPVTTYTLDTELANGEKIFLRKVGTKTRDEEKEDTSILEFKTEKEVLDIKSKLTDTFEVYYPKGKEDVKVMRRNPQDPFKTSTLQQVASNLFGWSVSKITKVIQDLYEGIKIDGEQTALITYPRTDSIRMSDTFKAAARKYIQSTYGDEYVNQGERPNKQAKKENVQDAHECIRVINPFTYPSSLKNKIKDEYAKMYELIWRRSVASLMTPCRYIHKTIRFKNDGCKFFTYSNVLEFDGYKRVYADATQVGAGTEKQYKDGQKIKAKSIECVKHVSEPPARYNQASLVKALDEAGVGRPSTYRMMVDVNPERGYCEVKNRAFYMTAIGNSVIEGLIANFDDVIDKNFTKEMEERLDAIADKKEPWNKWLLSFVPQFEKKVAAKTKTIEAKSLEVGRKCPKCGKPLVYRFSKKTKKQFIGCSDYPNCKYAEFPGTKELDVKCPICGKNLVQRTSKRGKPFIGCTGYPKCQFIANNLEEVKNWKPGQQPKKPTFKKKAK